MEPQRSCRWSFRALLVLEEVVLEMCALRGGRGGAGEKNRGMRLCDRASAMQFSHHGRCTRDTEKLCCAAVRKSNLNSSMIPGYLDD